MLKIIQIKSVQVMSQTKRYQLVSEDGVLGEYRSYNEARSARNNLYLHQAQVELKINDKGETR